MTLFKKVLDTLPSALVSHAMGRLSDVKFPPAVQKNINRGFVHAMHIDMSDAVHPADTFESLNALFTRAIRKDARPADKASVVSPVDGKISFAGRISARTLLHAKGREYDVRTLACIDDTSTCDIHPEWLDDAYAFIIYLAPYNYHRIHAPITGNVTHMTYAPGRLLPVNRLGYLLTHDLLPANERLTSFMTTPEGKKCALVKVGATCVGRISVKYDDFITNGVRRVPFNKTLDTPWHTEQCEELGCFELGSTVVLLLEGNGFQPSRTFEPGETIRLGQALGNWT